MAQDDRLKDLKQKVKDLQKEINAITGSKRMESDFKKWESLSDLKQKFIKELREHEYGKSISLKKFMALPDYYLFAHTKQTKRSDGKTARIKLKAIDDNTEWVVEAKKNGVSDAKLVANADEMRKDEWIKANKKRRKKKKTDDGDSGETPSGGLSRAEQVQSAGGS